MSDTEEDESAAVVPMGFSLKHTERLKRLDSGRKPNTSRSRPASSNSQGSDVPRTRRQSSFSVETLQRRESHMALPPNAAVQEEDDPIKAAQELLGKEGSRTRKALERLAENEKSQADQHRNSVVVNYPGYNPARPYPLPIQNLKQLKVRDLMRITMKANDTNLRRYGVRLQIKDLVLREEMRAFFRDAFWWLFIEFFAATDFEVLVTRAKKNVLVSEMDLQTYLYGTGVVTSQLPLPKHRRPALMEKRRSKITKEDYHTPSHVCTHVVRNRDAADVAHVGAPRSPSVSSLASTINSVSETGSTAIYTSPMSRDTSSEWVNESDGSRCTTPRAGGRGGVRSPSASSDASSTSSVMSAMRQNTFPLSHRTLHTLDENVRNQVVAMEQHQLFTRMSMNYSKLVMAMMPLHHSVKDCVTRLLPDIVAQCMFLAFAKSIPYAIHMLDNEFQAQLALILNYWMGGVERTGITRQWPIVKEVYPHLKKAKQRRRGQSNVSDDSSKDKSRKKKKGQVTQNRAQVLREEALKESMEKLQSIPIFGATVPEESRGRSRTARKLKSPESPVFGASPATARGPSKGNGDPPLMPVHRPAPPGANKSVPVQSSGPILSPRSRHTSTGTLRRTSFSEKVGLNNSPSRLPPMQRRSSLRRLSTREIKSAEELEAQAIQERKDQMIRRDVESMRNDLRKMISTHTFSQAHYNNTNTTAQSPQRPKQQTKSPKRPEGSASQHSGPKRLQHVYAIGPRKRTVQVIKEDLDQLYRETGAWYNDPKKRIPVKDALGASKFSLNNWSPLLHRFMLLNGEENRATADAMSWTQ